MRLAPASLSLRLLLVVISSVWLFSMVSFAIFINDRSGQAAFWAAKEWSQRIVDLLHLVDVLSPAERAPMLQRLSTQSLQINSANDNNVTSARKISDLKFAERLQTELARQLPRNRIRSVAAANADVTPDVVFVSDEHTGTIDSSNLYDVAVELTDGSVMTIRFSKADVTVASVTLALTLLMAFAAALVAGTYQVSRGISRPLLALAKAAEALGKGLEGAPISESGPKELRQTARAFNAMQDRLRRYVYNRTQVLTAMSHDLRTPITRIRLRCESIADSALRTKMIRDVEQMQLMIHESLDMLKGLQDSEAAARINVNALVSAICEDYAELGLTLHTQCNVLTPLWARPQLLRRALTNLLDNARKLVDVASLTVTDSSNEVIFKIADAGPGIPPAELERVFEPFYRLEASRNRDTGGAGLGLSIARDIAHTHGGQLTLANRTGGGLEATLVIPRTRENEAGRSRSNPRIADH